MFNQKLNQAAYAVLACLFLAPTLAWAGPTGGNITKGEAQISYDGSATNINQSSQKAAINWDGFSVAPHETVNFNQPNANAMTLNRVIGNEKSVIEGAINANGKVYLINSNGVLFTGTSKVNVGGLVASTLNLTDDDFMHGNFVFQSDQNNPAAIINQGDIIAADGGYVALMGGEVYNEGLIVASMGTVSLNSGQKVTLNFQGDFLLSATIDEAALASLVANKGAIIADGGLVIMTAKAAGDILSAQVNNEGLLQARTIGDLNGGYQEGEILLYAYDGTANIAGKLDASAPDGGDGGFIETSGDRVKIADDTVITTFAANGQTGTWLVDPTDFVIAANGGDMTGAALSSQLESNNVVIESQNGANDGNGDIYVNDKVTWNADTTLTLEALNDIFINDAITINGANAGLVMNFGGDYHILTKASFSGATIDANGKVVAKTDTAGGVYGSITFTNAVNATGLEINGQQYTLLHDINDVLDINNNLGGHYALAQNIDGGSHTTSVVNGEFTGTFAGLGHTVDNLTINGNISRIGFFKTLDTGSNVCNLGFSNVFINSTKGVIGVLAGSAKDTAVKYVYAHGSVNGASTVGGLIGSVNTSTIQACFTDVAVTATEKIKAGGLLAQVRDTVINFCHATGTVTSNSSEVGGLIGTFAFGSKVTGVYSLENCYATGDVTVSGAGGLGSKAGGLIGNLASYKDTHLTLKNSFATGRVRTAGGNTGGLLGWASGNSEKGGSLTIENCHATGDVYVDDGMLYRMAIGGLAGGLREVSVNNCYATGNVEAPHASAIGGLVGVATNSMFTNSVAYGNVRGVRAVGGFIGAQDGIPGNTSKYGTHIDNCHAYGNVYGEQSVGGLVGDSSAHFGPFNTISNSSASGDVYVLDLNYDVINGSGGALVGSGGRTDITDSSATGSVYGPANTTNPIGGLIGENSGGMDKGGNTYTDVKGQAAQAAADAAYKQQAIGNASAIANTTEQEVRQLSQDAPLMDMVASTGEEQQYVPGLSDDSGNTGFSWGRGDTEGEPLTLAMLGKRLFSAQIKVIMTDEGDIYDLTTEE